MATGGHSEHVRATSSHIGAEKSQRFLRFLTGSNPFCSTFFTGQGRGG